jgi:hypothetical protein
LWERRWQLARPLLESFNCDTSRAKPQFLHILRLVFVFQAWGTKTCEVMQKRTREMLFDALPMVVYRYLFPIAHIFTLAFDFPFMRLEMRNSVVSSNSAIHVFRML